MKWQTYVYIHMCIQVITGVCLTHISVKIWRSLTYKMPLITIQKITKGSIRINLHVCHLTSSSILYSVPSSKKPTIFKVQGTPFISKELRYSSFTQPEVAKSVAHRLGRKSKRGHMFIWIPQFSAFSCFVCGAHQNSLQITTLVFVAKMQRKIRILDLRVLSLQENEDPQFPDLAFTQDESDGSMDWDASGAFEEGHLRW